jgi:hypothetical protein
MKNLNRFMLWCLCASVQTLSTVSATPVTATQLKAAVKVAKNLKNAATTKSTGSTGKTPVLVQLAQNRFSYSGPAPQCTATMSPVTATLDSVYGSTFSCEDGIQSVNIGLTDAQGKTFLTLAIGQTSLTQAGIYSADGTGATSPEFYIGINILGTGTTATPYTVQVVFLTPQNTPLLTASYTVQSATEGFAYANIAINCSNTLIALPTNAVAANWLPIASGQVVHYKQSATTTTPPLYGGITVPAAPAVVAGAATPPPAAKTQISVTPQLLQPAANAFILGTGSTTVPADMGFPNGQPGGYGGTGFASATAAFVANITSNPAAKVYSGTVTAPQGGLVRLNVGVTDGTSFASFNFNRCIFNTMAMQTLLQQGMYILVNLVTTPNPAIVVQLTDVKGTVYAQGTLPIPANTNPTTYNVGFNTDDTNNSNGTTKTAVVGVPIGTSVLYQQTGQTSTLNYLSIADGSLAGTGNQNITNISVLTGAAVTIAGPTNTFPTGTTNFSPVTASITSTNIYMPTGTTTPTPYACTNGLSTALDISITDQSQQYFITQNFDNTVLGQQQMQDLMQLGMFIVVDVVQTPTPAVSFYVTDVNGVMYAQGSAALAANAAPTSVYVLFNTTSATAVTAGQLGADAVGAIAVPLGQVIWYQQPATVTTTSTVTQPAKTVAPTPATPATCSPTAAFQAVSVNNLFNAIQNNGPFTSASCANGLNSIVVMLSDGTCSVPVTFDTTQPEVAAVVNPTGIYAAGFNVGVAQVVTQGTYQAQVVLIDSAGTQVLASQTVPLPANVGFTMYHVGFNMNPLTGTAGANATYINQVPITSNLDLMDAVSYVQIANVTSTPVGTQS